MLIGRRRRGDSRENVLGTECFILLLALLSAVKRYILLRMKVNVRDLLQKERVAAIAKGRTDLPSGGPELGDEFSTLLFVRRFGGRNSLLLGGIVIVAGSIGAALALYFSGSADFPKWASFAYIPGFLGIGLIFLCLAQLYSECKSNRIEDAHPLVLTHPWLPWLLCCQGLVLMRGRRDASSGNWSLGLEEATKYEIGEALLLFLAREDLEAMNWPAEHAIRWPSPLRRPLRHTTIGPTGPLGVCRITRPRQDFRRSGRASVLGTAGGLLG